MGTNEIIKEAINLKPQEKYLIIESLILSLNEPNKEIEKLWIEESEKDWKNIKWKFRNTIFEEVFN